MARSIHVFFLILLLHVLESALANKLSSLSLADECSLLFQLKQSMTINKSGSYDPRAYPKVASWNLNGSDGAGNCCLWDGVECRFGHVIGLDLSSSFLYGTISSNNSLFDLIHLRTLNLADNNFHSSQIPSGIGRLSQLANLNLSSSFFSGKVPKQISHLRNLVSLDLTGNLYIVYNLYQLELQSSDFQNLVQNSSETLRELFLSRVNIDSELPASIGNLTHLNILDLSWCGFTGTLPASVSNLTQLTFLDLSVNQELLIPIPHLASLSKLKYLKLGDAIFDRNNSCDWLGKFPNLFYLDLSYTSLNCEIPSSIGNQTQLRELYLRSIGMIGQIPSSFTNLTHLTALDLSENMLTSSLPSLESFSNLTSLSLSYNNFDRWKLPDWFGKLNKITYFGISDANLYGEIPSSFFNLTQVEELYLYGNNLTVDFNLIFSLRKLKYLDLSGNNITLSVIDSHRNETQPKFKYISLASCNLKVFPEFLRFQNQLEHLYLDNNNMEGLVPGWMWNISKDTLLELTLINNLLMGFEQHSPLDSWVSLQLLDLSNNMLHESIPVPPPTIEFFSVSNNNLTGEIPPSICDLTSLHLLDLSFNNITGSIPPCLEKLSNSSLTVLNLRSNILQGTIPNIFSTESKLEMIDLSENKLEGQVPRSLENCDSLRLLDLGYNFLEDMFPVWLGALSELQYFQEWSTMKETKANTTYMETYIEDDSIFKTYWFSIHMTNKGEKMDYKKIMNTFSAVDLSSNMFRGKIPESIKTLSGILLLNLSNNELSGAIPPSMGNLIRLEALDISGNKLSGMIPQDLVQLNFLAFLNVSNNNLTGPIPQGKQFNTFSNDSYMGNALCGFPLSMKCGDSEASKPPKVSFEEDTESYFPNGSDWVVILIGAVTGLVIGLVCGDYLSTKYYRWFSQRSRR
ncbi:putative leucine-rich repeat-containing, plant-type, leucine-rich repeat domain superfamily [Helianthus annuus]|nr:putative leucine-rich repeat-containing, plant-type, leucine-rich repeat domain superfamily [Helianthus annuus]